MNENELPTFGDAKSRFRQFISEHGHDATLRWVFRSDIVELGFRRFVRLPLPDYEQAVERHYENGIQRGLGINFHVYCFLDGQPLCYIWLPEDEMDAEYRMLSGLKLSVPAEPERYCVVGVHSRIRWTWLRWKERRTTRHQWADDIPQR